MMVLASVIVPSQANVTVPPPAMARRNAASLQLVTTLELAVVKVWSPP